MEGSMTQCMVNTSITAEMEELFHIVLLHYGPGLNSLFLSYFSGFCKSVVKEEVNGLLALLQTLLQ